MKLSIAKDLGPGPAGFRLGSASPVSSALQGENDNSRRGFAENDGEGTVSVFPNEYGRINEMDVAGILMVLRDFTNRRYLLHLSALLRRKRSVPLAKAWLAFLQTTTFALNF